MSTQTTHIRAGARAAFTEWLRHFNKRATNRLMIRLAGKRIISLVHHTGRKSGAAYQTPVIAFPAEGGFIIPLTYGPHTDWCRNVMAAGGCLLDWRGQPYELDNPRLAEPGEALPAIPGWLRPMLRHIEVHLRLDKAEPKMRRILVYGAGVLGSVYAGKLHHAGYDVTLLARGKRLEELRERGLVLVEDETGQEERIPVNVTDRLAPEDGYDLALVVIRKNQVPSVLPALAAGGIPNVVFMVNNAEGPGPMVEALGRERVLLGFPGGGGQRSDGVVRYKLSPRSAQPTTIGELDGRSTPRLAQITQILESAGLPVAVSENMEAWLKTHVALVSPIANALYMAGGSNYRLANTRDGIVLMVRAVKEGLRVLRALGVPVTPARYRALALLPEPLLVSMLQKSLPSKSAELMLARHANAARDEMQVLADEFRALARRSGVPTPAIDELYRYLDPSAAIAPEGQASLALDWRSTIAATGAILSALILIGYLLRKRRR